MALGESYPRNRKDRDGVRERLRWFQAAVAAHPRSAAAHSNLGGVLQDKGDRDGAIEEFQAAIRLDPKNSSGPLNLGHVLHAKGEKLALAEYQKAVKLDPKDAAARLMLGLSLATTGERDAGFAELQEAVKLKPTFAAARMGLGIALLTRKKLDDAIAEFREAVRLDPKLSFARHALGHGLMNKGDVDGALAENRAALKIDPDLPLAHNDLGWILATGPERVIDGKKALEHAQRACELTEWKNPSCIATLAAAYAELRDFDRAVELQKRALSFPEYEKEVGETVWEMLDAYVQKERVRDEKLAPSPELLRQLAMEMEKGGFRHEYAAEIIKDLINFQEQLKQFDQAETWRRKWLAVVKEKSGGDSLPYAGELMSLSGNLFRQKKWTDAEGVLRECLAVRERKSPDSWTRFHAVSLVGAALLGQKKYAEAEPLLLEGYNGMKEREKTIPPKNKSRLIEAAERLVQLYDATKKDEAAKWRAIREQHEGTKVGGVHDVGDGLTLSGKLDGETSTLWYEVKLRAGKTYVIDMVSGDQKALDPFLVLTDSGGKHLAEDDDGGGGLNARIAYRALRDGVYRIHATSFDAGRGEFTLTVREGTKVGVVVHEVGDGLTLSGKLDDKTTALVYALKLSAGKTYVIDMVSPDQKALDPYLVLTDADGKRLAEDDDGGSGLNARITYRVGQDGLYRIHATSFEPGRGEFTLTVRETKEATR
jgi:tetratricopeptide (TPR) repeat protein